MRHRQIQTKRFRARIVGQAEAVVDFGMTGVSSAVQRHRNFGIIQHSAKPLGLRAGIGMVSDIEHQERRNAFAFRDMRHCRVIDMLRRIVAEFFPVTKLRLRLMMDSATCFCSLDDRWHVIGVAIDRYAAFDAARDTPSALRYRSSMQIIAASGRGGVSHDEDSIRIAAVLSNVIVDPVHRFRNVAEDRLHFDIRQQSVIRRDKHAAPLDEGLRFDLHTSILSPACQPPP